MSARWSAALALLAAIVFGCGGGKAPLTDESGVAKPVYLKNNIHSQDRPDRGGKTVSRASYANYIDSGAGHHFLSVNTQVTIGNWRGGFRITRVSDGKLIHFEYNRRNIKMELHHYLDLITSPTPVSMFGLSENDLEGIKNGKAYLGMTKDGVRMALGYPAPHRTPSLENNVWTYWRNRWVMQSVEFNANDQVIEIK